MYGRTRRSKTDPREYDDIPKNYSGKGRLWKRQKVLICIACFKKRAEIPGVPCKWCKGLENKGYDQIEELKERCKE